jgi:hypothetical protein
MSTQPVRQAVSKKPFTQTAACGWMITASVWIGLVAASVGIILAINAILPNPENSLWKTVVRSLGAGLGAGLYLLSRGLRAYGRRLRLADAATRLRHDPRPPVVYLRSFQDDEVTYYRQGETLEELLMAVFRKVGPFVAIGRPNEKLPPLGAARFQIPGEDWKQTATELMDRAGLIVLRPGETDGVLWEVRAIMERLKSTGPRKLLITLVPELEAGRKSSRKGNIAERMRRYERFRELTKSLFPCPLPPIGEKALFIGFEADWSPVVLNTKRSWYSFGSNPRAVLREALEPFAIKAGVAVKKMSYDLAPAFYGWVIAVVAMQSGLNQIEAPWKEFAAPDGSFRVQAPAAMTELPPLSGPGGTQRRYTFHASGMDYIAITTDLKGADRLSAAEIVDAVRKNEEASLAQKEACAVARETKLDPGDRPGYEIVLQCGPKKRALRFRIYASGKRVTMFGTDNTDASESVSESSPNTTRFFNSIEIR